MRYFFRHIIIVLLLSMTFISLHGCREKGVIEKDDMAQIYAEMLMTDQWINSNTGVRRIADTSLVYEPILKKYGYTSETYRKSVEYYLQDPDTYAEIMAETIKILDARLAGLNRKKQEIAENDLRASYVRGFARYVNIDDSWLSMNHISKNDTLRFDSLAVVWDTVAYCYNISRVLKGQSTDSLAVCDTLHVGDTLNVCDSIPVSDSLVPPLADSMAVKEILDKKFDTLKGPDKDRLQKIKENSRFSRSNKADTLMKRL